MSRQRAAFAAAAVVAVLVSSVVVLGFAGRPGGAVQSESDVETCTTPDVVDEPPCNPALVDSPWGASHRNSYSQASSAWPGPDADTEVEARHVDLPGIPIQLQFSEPYDDDGVAVWGSLLNTADSRAVVKLDHRTGEVIDVYLPAEREDQPPEPGGGGITGAYSLLDRDGRFIVGRQRSLEVYADSVAGDRASAIELVTRFALPESAFCTDADRLVGATMTYDGMVAFATEQGVVGVVPRQPERMTADQVVTVSLNGDRCTDEDPDLEIVSNSVAADEDGGIYVVTSGAMHSVDWDPEAGTLSLTWTAGYETGTGRSAIRLGAGSGSTPSLMGTGADEDRFVVVTDGQDLMHVVLFWRDDVPGDWEPVRPGADPRIACEFPITFGDADAVETISEQSVLVRGYSTVHVNNKIVDESVIEGLAPDLASALAALEGGDPVQAPSGIERVDWDPTTRTCTSVWANDELSIPNGIPTMSASSDLFYGRGLREGVWGIEAVDYGTGESVAWFPARNDPCTEEALSAAEPAQRAALDAVVERLPNSCENSVYAATEVGPDGAIYTGTLFGATSHVPTEPLAPPVAGGDEVAEEVQESGAATEKNDETGWSPWVVVVIALLCGGVAATVVHRLRTTRGRGVS